MYYVLRDITKISYLNLISCLMGFWGFGVLGF